MRDFEGYDEVFIVNGGIIGGGSRSVFMDVYASSADFPYRIVEL
jgi:hypothetical protein